jgi:hypothetical protein
VSPDHIHLLVSAPPLLASAKLVQCVKGKSSRQLQEDFPHLRKRYWGQYMWARGYFCATGKQKHHQPEPSSPRGRIPKSATLVERMKRKLMTKPGLAIYARRKTIVEPVFGQIKQAQGFRQFLLRGVEKVRSEWALVCATHNMLKLYRACTA